MTSSRYWIAPAWLNAALFLLLLPAGPARASGTSQAAKCAESGLLPISMFSICLDAYNLLMREARDTKLTQEQRKGRLEVAASVLDRIENDYLKTFGPGTETYANAAPDVQRQWDELNAENNRRRSQVWQAKKVVDAPVEEEEQPPPPTSVEGAKTVVTAIMAPVLGRIEDSKGEVSRSVDSLSSWWDDDDDDLDEEEEPRDGSDENAPRTKPQPPTPAQIRQVEAETDRQYPGNAEIKKVLADRYIAFGSPRDAERAATQALASNPNDADTLSLRARARALSGNTAGAVDDAERALKLKPGDETAKMILANRDNLARSAAKIKRMKLDFGAAREVDPMGGATLASVGGAGWGAGAKFTAFTAPPLPPGAQRFYDSARTKFGVGDHKGALWDVGRAIGAAPQAPSPLILRARISRGLKNYEGAVADATKALELSPSDANALRERALAFMELGRLPEALADLERAVALEPANGTGYLYRAMVYERLGRTEEALADLAKAVALDPALKPLAEEIAERINGPAKAARARTGLMERKLLRLGAVGASLLLLLLGLAGTAKGRALVTTTAKTLFRSGEAPTLVDAPAELAPGAVLGGTYSVVRELGRGGMGVVYEAVDTALQRRVAIKRLARDAATTQADLDRFLEEARVVARLSHPRVAEIYNVLVDRDLFLVFELVPGEPLDAVLGRRLRLPLSEARRVMADVAAGVGAAHDLKIIHRDLKPSNVMLESPGGAKVMDFGIAHQARSAATQLTRTSASGTPPYMSPEQALGSVSKASDLYAMAVMTYELILGRRPFEGPDFLEQKLALAFARPSAVDPALPKGLDAFFAQALHPDPTKRPASAADFIRSLDAACG